MVNVEERESALESETGAGAPRVGLDRLVTALFGLVGWVVGSARLSDNSFLWHLRTGAWILDHGIPHHDPFSFTARGVDWVAQSWLAELAYGILDRTLGAFAIRCFMGIVAAAFAVSAYRLALRLVGSPLVAAGLAAVSLAGPFVAWSERPLALGLGCLLALVWVVEVPDSRLGRHAAVATVVILVLWVNVHGTFMLGLAYLALHVLGCLVDGRRDHHLRALVIGGSVGCLLAFANPYGPSLVLFPIHLLGRGDVLRRVVEWQSPDFRSTIGQALALWLVVVVVVAARGRLRLARRDLLVLLPMACLAFWAQRNIAVAPVVALPILARACAGARAGRLEKVDRGAARVAMTFVVLLIVGAGIVAAGQPNYALEKYPTRALRWVDRQGLLGQRMLTTDVAGGYVIAAYFPEQKVFVDDRYDMYPRPVLDDYLTLLDGGRRWGRVLDARRVELVVWRRAAPLGTLLDGSAEWERTHDAGRWSVWVRR